MAAIEGLAHPRRPLPHPGRRGRPGRPARGRTLAFIEVKARATEADAALALDEWRLRRVAAAAEALMPRYMPGGDTVRLDAIFMIPRRWPRHVTNVWHG